MRIRALSSLRVQGKEGQMVHLVPGDTYDLDRDIAESLIGTGDAVGLQEYETQVQAPPETKASAEDEPDVVEATPAASELAEEEDVDLSEVEATGADGKVLKSDVEAHI